MGKALHCSAIWSLLRQNIANGNSLAGILGIQREWEEQRRQWREEHERATSPESMSMKWRYFRIVCTWVGIGALVKLALFQAVGAAREHAMLAENVHESQLVKNGARLDVTRRSKQGKADR